ncbi:BREX-1 system phosphatase PglZ type A [Lactobacillus sp. UCMA15818]|uniref:BREX-1 system phosphatase PglZ type A n=1 Tax=Lactobacillus sp. UCMA15818 TaxID=2583394 RepID=UPI0025B0D3E7|nr:BREX-1 system phosphatase PglZ type A [Lactobacillus sp. UCMA15818]MDN2452155.1 BREX-1 system phosphatase PglZ type A [Lactobacillus sp. UCMA15818]
MSDLNLSQIQTRLNELFVTYGERKLIFWFDPKNEFEEDIDKKQIQLNDAKIYKLESRTQLMTKRFFEIEDKKNNYLIYAPFKKMDDDDENNHLLSIMKYSSQFSADRISLIMTQLNIPSNLHDTMEKYTKFFGAKSRIAAFEKLMTTKINSKQELEITLIAVVTKANTAQIYSIIQALLIDYTNTSSNLYDQLASFGLQEALWKYISKYYGYTAKEPTIQKLAISFFANAFYGQMGHQKLPANLKEYEVPNQTTAIVSFMDGVMNDSRYTATFDKLSKDTYCLIGGDKILAKAPIEELLAADIFEPIHILVIQYYIRQLMSGDLTPMISGISLSEALILKQRAHFGIKYVHQYEVILNAQKILKYVLNTNTDQFTSFVKDYETSSYLVDQYYRKFIWHLDRCAEQDKFTKLQVLVEKQYRTFLDEIGRLWNALLYLDERPSMLDFYDKFAKNKMKTVVIISDALRYEVAKEIQQFLEQEKKYSSKMDTIFTVLPSVTEFGKAASLRGNHEPYEYIKDTDVRVNGLKTQGTVARNKILKEKNSNSLAITYENVMGKSNAKELREVFNGQEVIYLYHDQIDATGDKIGTESQVFNAVENTIKELIALIQFISNGANVYRFIITSDHGFIYTRSKVEEHEKIENPSSSDLDHVERRFIISKNHYDEIGIGSVKLGDVLHNEDDRYVHFPETSAIFKKAGGGQNYVHGGSSPQEMIVPVLEISVARGSAQKKPVTIQLMTAKRKIIGLSVALEFYQTEAINDSVTKAQYSLYFEDGKGNLITNQNAYYADSTSGQSSERFTNFTFDFVNRNYDTNEKIYLIVKNEETKIETEHIEFAIDNPFAGGFGFDI